MASSQFKIPQLDEHARAIGYVCIVWGWLELSINLLIAELAPMPNAAISNCITHNADIRDKIKMAKAIAFLRQPSNDWYERVAKTLDEIDNVLRNERNRFIHDRWSTSTGDNPLKETLKTKIVKPQAFQKALELSVSKPVTSDEVWNVVDRIVLASVSLNRAVFQHPSMKGKVRTSS